MASTDKVFIQMVIRPALLLPGILSVVLAADPDGAAIYRQRCAACHEVSKETRAPAPAALRLMAPENIVKALESGMMKDQGAAMAADERRIVAEFLLVNRSVRVRGPEPECHGFRRGVYGVGRELERMGRGSFQHPFQSAEQAGIDADQIPRLKLKWAFAFPNTFAVSNGQPTMVGGRVFVPSANRKVYSLDARSGCRVLVDRNAGPRADGDYRSTVKGRKRARWRFLAIAGNAYAVDAASGELLWKTHVDDHVNAKIIGAPEYSEGRVYVPLPPPKRARP